MCAIGREGEVVRGIDVHRYAVVLWSGEGVMMDSERRGGGCVVRASLWFSDYAMSR